MDQIAIGKFIAEKRKEQNLTQEQLAERLGVSNKTISKWETAKCMPDYTVITKLCEELNITISELMDGEESDGKSVRVYDDEQILDLLRRTQELEKQKVMMTGVLSLLWELLSKHYHIPWAVQMLRTSFRDCCWDYQSLKCLQVFMLLLKAQKENKIWKLPRR